MIYFSNYMIFVPTDKLAQLSSSSLRCQKTPTNPYVPDPDVLLSAVQNSPSV